MVIKKTSKNCYSIIVMFNLFMCNEKVQYAIYTCIRVCVCVYIWDDMRVDFNYVLFYG